MYAQHYWPFLQNTGVSRGGVNRAASVRTTHVLFSPESSCRPSPPPKAVPAPAQQSQHRDGDQRPQRQQHPLSTDPTERERSRGQLHLIRPSLVLSGTRLKGETSELTGGVSLDTNTSAIEDWTRAISLAAQISQQHIMDTRGAVKYSCHHDIHHTSWFLTVHGYPYQYVLQC